MTILLTAYALIIITIGIYDYFKIKTFDDFALAGRRRGQKIVAASILASVLGASATIGVVQLAYSSGAAAFLWLGSGALGLIISGLFIAKKIHQTGAKTLVEAAEILIGTPCSKVIGFLILIAWTGIVAAQFIAAAKIVAANTNISYPAALAITSFLIASYCTMGGQMSVFKTDFVQFVAIVIGIAVTLFFLYEKGDLGSVIESSKTQITITKAGYFFLVVGSGFVIGPDIFSRLFSASNSTNAKSAAITAGLILLPISVGIVSIGLWVRACGNMPQGQEALVWVLNAAVPPAAGVIMSLGLLSAIVSSADTCLITASVILSRQIKQDPPLWAIRAATMGIAAAALVIAWLKADIISTLLLSYSVFNCGVIAPLFLAIIFAGKKRLNEKIAIISILVGGLLGLYANFSQHKQSLAIIAFTASAIIAFIAIVPVKQPKCCK